HSYVESLLIISRKLLRISFALLQKNTPFDASFPLFSGLLPLTGIPTGACPEPVEWAEESFKKCKRSLHSPRFAGFSRDDKEKAKDMTFYVEIAI
ncbi:hypothetical protein K9L63_03240, partial [Candidatus Gracilibacteria bacterium]|nr:hypothetical protein [Candidatus Gracilibacteria bacterium]